MKRTLSTSSAIASALLALVAVATVRGSLRPRYGGTLRVEMRARPNSMDPRDWYAGAPDSASTERLLELVFDRLIALDESGRVVPALALAWQHDANFTHWQFLMREGVKFHDGTPLTAAAAAAALEVESADQWQAKPNDNFLTFTFTEPRPELLSELIHGRSFIFRATPDTVIGSGPFRIADWQPQKNLALIANEDAWSGRPFVDRAEFQFGIQPSQQSIDLEIGKTDIAELLPAQTRIAPRGGARVASSSPVELLALVAANSRASSASADPNLRRALSLSIDRGSIVNVLLQHQGERAGGLLPQWISGYAFAFSTAIHLELARQLRAQLSASPSLTLVYDGADSVAAQIAERIAVNARDAGIIVNVSPENSSGAARVDFRLVRERLMPSDAHEALNSLLSRIEPQQPAAQKPALDSPEQRYQAERAAIDSGAIIPLAFVPEIYGVSSSVHDWISPRWGGWQLADVWLEQPASAASAAAPEK
jgi:peptide/nickel transport system substrate-binding protein